MRLHEYFKAVVTKEPPKNSFMGMARLDLGENTTVKVMLTASNPSAPPKRGEHIGAKMAGFYVEENGKIVPWVIQQPKF